MSRTTEFMAREAEIPLYKVFQKKKRKLQSKLLHERDRYMQIKKNLILNQQIFRNLIERKHASYCIVDDVWTSGATLNFAAKLLKENGISEESISVLAFFKDE